MILILYRLYIYACRFLAAFLSLAREMVRRLRSVSAEALPRQLAEALESRSTAVVQHYRELWEQDPNEKLCAELLKV